MALSTLDKAIDLLFHLHASGTPLGATGAGQALGLSKSSAHRLLATLARRGLLEREPGGRYRPGAALVALGLGVLEREPLVELARPILEAESRALGETVFLTAPRTGKILILDKAEGTGFLRAAPRVGSFVPIHASAVGRLVLAHAPGEVDFDPTTLEPFTSRTVRTALALRSEVERARLRGFAENHGEWIAGLSVVAAPVFVRGRLQAALAAAAPTERMQQLDPRLVGARLRAAADRLGAALGGVPMGTPGSATTSGATP